MRDRRGRAGPSRVISTTKRSIGQGHDGPPVTASTVVAIGDLDLVRPLRRAGAEVVLLADERSPARWSRDVARVVALPDPHHDGALIDLLLGLVAGADRPVPLFYQGDQELLAISRHRERLRPAFGFVLPPPDVVEDLVDKARFQELARRLELPVPPATLLQARDAEAHRLSGPALVKPVNRTGAWRRIGLEAKAVQVADDAALRELADRVGAEFPDLLVQHLVPGDEDRIESYHVYVDASGRIAGEFTGRKVRTHPRRFGFTTSLVTTDERDVRDLGRRVVERTGLLGVAKVDVKRDPDGRLWVLEVNPRFNLWHHPGAVAGVNLPALVLADVTGTSRPPAVGVRTGVRWSMPLRDLKAARAGGEPLGAWLRWTLRSDAYQDLARHDVAPFLRGAVWPMVRRRVTARG